MEILNILGKVTDIAGASTFSVVVKIVLLLLSGVVGIWWKLKKRKAAKKASHAASIDAQRGAATDAQTISEGARTSETDIDDILGD